MRAPDSCYNISAIYSWLFLDWVAQGAFMATQIVLTQENGASFARIMSPVYASGILIGMPLMGVLSDRCGRKAGFAADTFLGTMIPSAGLAILFYFDLTKNLVPVLAVMWLWGFAGCATSVTAASIGDIIPKEERTRYVGYNLGIMFFGMAVGFGLGDPSVMPPAAACATAAIVSAINGSVMLVCTVETKVRQTAQSTSKGVAAMSVNDMFHDANLPLLFIVTLAQFFSYSIFEGCSTLAAKEIWLLEGTSFTLIAGLVAAVFAVTLLGPLVKMTGVAQGLATGHLFRSVGFASVVVLWAVPNVLTFAWVCVSIGIQVIDATASSMLTMMVPQNSGTTIGINRAFGAFGRMLGPFIALTLWDKGYMKSPFVLSSVVSFAAVGLVFLKGRAMNDAATGGPKKEPLLVAD